MAKWLVSIYVGVSGSDSMPDPTFTYIPRWQFDGLKVGGFLRTTRGDYKIRKIKMSPFGKPWHKLLACVPPEQI